MKTDYESVPIGSAYELMNPGGIVLLCTKGGGRYDLAPIAWACPLDYSPVSKILVVCDTGHKTLADLRASGEFAVAFPTPVQRRLVEEAGLVSGRDVDKYAKLGIDFRRAVRVDTRIPEGAAGWLECRVIRIIEEGTSAIVMGEVLAAFAVPEAWKARLHYAREGVWYAPGPNLA
jgi:flavin reductase (DIM6/NTAB) family NADH-FMN oxidoreductase RutF